MYNSYCFVQTSRSLRSLERRNVCSYSCSRERLLGAKACEGELSITFASDLLCRALRSTRSRNVLGSPMSLLLSVKVEYTPI